MKNIFNVEKLSKPKTIVKNKKLNGYQIDSLFLKILFLSLKFG